MATRDQLIKQIEAFIELHDMPPSTFGKLAINDPALMLGLTKQGRDLKTETVDRIYKFMAQYKPPKRTKTRPKGSPARAAA